jgi:hypothetical protein
MTNSEKKQKIWSDFFKKISHLENYCKIELSGIDDESVYFHPKFILDDDAFISGQSDTNNRYVYALSFVFKDIRVDIYEDLLENLIIGYNQNKNVVLEALITLSKVKQHVRKIDNYTVDFVNNLILGSSISELTTSLINEVKTAEKVISLMQKNN